MAGRRIILLQALCLLSILAQSEEDGCSIGFIMEDDGCIGNEWRTEELLKEEVTDSDECADDAEDSAGDGGRCGENAECINTLGSFSCKCRKGYQSLQEGLQMCQDINECWARKDICGPRATCVNSIGSYQCVCKKGFVASPRGRRDDYDCDDEDECLEENICGSNATCINTEGSYNCVCHVGFANKSGGLTSTSNEEPCEEICPTINCGNGSCHIGATGHYCACHAGSTNYGKEAAPCMALNCDAFKDTKDLKENLPIARDLMMRLERSCVNLTGSGDPKVLDGEELVSALLDLIDQILLSGVLRDNKKVSIFLDIAESALRLVGPFMKPPRARRSSTYTELELLSHKGPVPPEGAVTLSTKPVQLDIQMSTVAGDPSQFPGFATVFLLSYANLEIPTSGYYGGMDLQTNRSFIVNSKVATVSVTNANTSRLDAPVTLTFHHTQQVNGSQHTCVFWDGSQEGGSWSSRGCTRVESNAESTVCSCDHLSSFAVLMALYDVEHRFELQFITRVGLSLSLMCLLVCIFTFSLVRPIQGPRTTIHLHLCISLFVAVLIFLTAITRTENQSVCAVVAGLLHFFFLASFCWMCVEGVQLFRMVILVFNTNFRTLYMMAGGYGVPAVIVAISTVIHPKGYGTDKYCWLNLDFIWSFLGPVCVIIAVNIVFFLITIWKLLQKFSSLNPEMDTLQKIRAFTITAVAQLCVLGTTWIFGCFQFGESTIVMSYLFTVFASLQGVMLFTMHCLFSKQVRDEYGSFLCRFCTPPTKNYKEFSSLSSRPQASNSTQDTGESRI
ncbi:adhesion G protein-coupled receptor E3-like isoform X1 [Nerophis lumbriciformis]|uniref:adhesion G protein-coupled receptor E3-like isoform X1 n=1 Tax=Nerophis lumbriciformis TaxID=546530 RepID=UPI002AE0842B|nr:adhesion G protein-coupled receptor E2-like isoform X1 [Nerophis lumbriciformis]